MWVRTALCRTCRCTLQSMRASCRPIKRDVLTMCCAMCNCAMCSSQCAEYHVGSETMSMWFLLSIADDLRTNQPSLRVTHMQHHLVSSCKKVKNHQGARVVPAPLGGALSPCGASFVCERKHVVTVEQTPCYDNNNRHMCVRMWTPDGHRLNKSAINIYP